MLFTTTPQHRTMEKMMRKIPRPRERNRPQLLVRCMPRGLMEEPGPINESDIFREMQPEVLQPSYPGMEVEIELPFWDEAHEEAFSDSRVQLNRHNPTILAALYLLTASPKLWKRMQARVGKNRISFTGVSLGGCTGNDYVLFCCAKDLCLGTNHIDIRDIADPDLVSEKAFLLIQTAITLRRRERDLQKPTRKGELE